MSSTSSISNTSKLTSAQAKDVAGLSLYKDKDKETINPSDPSLTTDKDPRLENKYYKIQLQSTEHRISLISQWKYSFEGKRVLEIGCGQGDCTAVLAELVGPNGHVTAVDPGPLDYGTPFNLGQAQGHLSRGRLGDKITWRQADPLKLLSSESTEYDVAVLALCTWYFSSPKVLTKILEALLKRVTHLCIAEWSLTSATADTHILAALTQATRESHDPNSSSNIRTIFSPQQIRVVAVKAGWALAENEATTFTPADHVLDGKWEVKAVTDPDFVEGLDKILPDKEENARQRAVLFALRDATIASLDELGGMKKVKSMDVWCAEFVR